MQKYKICPSCHSKNEPTLLECLYCETDLTRVKITDEETEKMLKYANEGLILEILPVLDNFERAISMNENVGEEAKKFIDGMKMVHQGLISALNKHGVSEIECLGKKFDPSLEQAVMTAEEKDKESDIILEVYQKGYMLKDKLIRPAMVKVNK